MGTVSWGRAWGDSWGLSWGLTYEANQEDLTITGGIGHSKSKKKRVYLERDGKVLLFNSAADAAAYIQAEKPVETPQKPVRKPKKQRKVPEPQVINVEALKAYFTAVQEPQIVEEITQSLQIKDFELLLKLQEMWLREEDDIETLLLVV